MIIVDSNTVPIVKVSYRRSCPAHLINATISVVRFGIGGCTRCCSEFWA
jgi:hypothetical protein